MYTEELQGKLLYTFKFIAIVTMVISGYISTTYAQPMLNPVSTVNPVNGQMAFSLPLGEVRGLNGTNFPVNLNYGAGINVLQNASECGLGFSIDAGSITRKKVMIADNNIGNDGAVERYKFNFDPSTWNCMTTFQKCVVFIGLIVVHLAGIIAIACTGGTGAVVVVGTIAQVVSLAGPSVMTSLLSSPQNYSAGGSHESAYDFEHGNGKGYFRGGHLDDLPDVYFINTSFINGEMFPAGNPQDGEFVLKSTTGNTVQIKSTVVIKYDIANNTFTVKLVDGTTLYFKKSDKAPHREAIWGKQGNCDYVASIKTKEQETDKWWLTTVLYPDYIDGSTPPDDDPLNSKLLNKGNWFSVEYGVLTGYLELQDPLLYYKKTSPYDFMKTYYGRIYWEDDNEYTPMIPMEKYYIKSIISPVDKATFTQMMDREDQKWDFGEFKDGGLTYKDTLGPRLTAIEFGLQTNLRQKIDFQYSYKLKSFSAVFIPPNHTYTSLLTLDQITNRGKIETGWNNGWITKFDYVMSNPRVTIPDGTNLITSDIYQTDYWGYYSPNLPQSYPGAPLLVPDYNASGLQGRTEDVDKRPYAAAWSLESVNFPNGSTIRWEYEANRYDKANNVAVTSVEGASVPKFGGGIRVKKVSMFDGITQKNKSWSYFYTDYTPGIFTGIENNTNSSGHATAEPFPYLLGMDPRPNKSRGGHYTAAQVMYETIIMAEDFKDGKAPNGYMVMEFTSPADYPNGGMFGTIDNSWKRGYLKRQRIYNAVNQLISKEERTYEFSPQYTYDLGMSWVWVGLPFAINRSLHENTSGWVKLEKTETFSNGITQVNTPVFASDLPATEKDNLSYYKNEVRDLRLDDVVKYPSTNIATMFTDTRMVGCRTNIFGSDPAKDDYVLVKTDNVRTISFCIGKDVGSYSVNGVVEGVWTNWMHNDFPELLPTPLNVSGAAMVNLDGGTTANDLMVVTNIGASVNVYLIVFVFHNVNIDNSNNIVVGNITRTEVLLSQEPAGIQIYDKDCPTSCIIGNFTGTSNPDILITPNHPSLEGDRLQSENRNILAITDFAEDNNGHIDCPLWATTKSYPYFGRAVYMTAADPDGAIDDFVIAGPGAVAAAATPFNTSLQRPTWLQTFKNIRFNESNHQITFSPDNNNPCPEITNGTAEIFNQQPDGSFAWGETKFTGAFADKVNNCERLHFFTAKDGHTVFNLINYHKNVRIPVDFDGIPNRNINKNSDNSFVVTTTIPAYWKYPGMGTIGGTNHKNMFAQQCGSVGYRFPAGTDDAVLKGNLDAYSGKVIAANAATWMSLNTTYVPCASYSWQVPMTSAGLPEVPYTPFNYDHPTLSDPAWKLVDSISSFTTNLQPKEKATPNSNGGRTCTSTIYGHEGILPVATVTNARWSECGVFTGEYQNAGNTNYWDYENGWEKGQGDNGHTAPLLSTTVTHFGQQAISVTNNYAAGRNCRIYPGKTYTFGAWVKVTQGRFFLAASYHSRAATSISWPVTLGELTTESGIPIDSVSNASTQGQWKLLTLTIPASRTALCTDNAKEYYARVWVGNRGDFQNSEGVQAYVDDIRFAPQNAQVATVYYDTKWQQPRVTVNANGKPGELVTYDSFGRPEKWEKIDPSKTATDPDFAKVLQTKRYHLMNETE